MCDEQRRGTSAYDNREMVCSILLVESLLSHPNLAQSQHLVNEAVKILDGKISNDYYILFIALTHMNIGPGRYAHIHNYLVDQYILRKDWKSLIIEAKKGIDAFPEVYCNSNMTQEEIDKVSSSIEIERQTIQSVIDNYEEMYMIHL